MVLAEPADDFTVLTDDYIDRNQVDHDKSAVVGTRDVLWCCVPQLTESDTSTRVNGFLDKFIEFGRAVLVCHTMQILP